MRALPPGDPRVLLPPITAWKALVMTRGQWKRVADGRVACPVCGRLCEWPDWTRLAHVRVHLREGWRPTPEVHEAAETCLPSPAGPRL